MPAPGTPSFEQGAARENATGSGCSASLRETERKRDL